jgi:p-aminobenzoyl-glutamate transporter AbgT
MDNHEFDFLGIPSTILSWLAFFNLVSISPILNGLVSIMSLVWLSMQIYGWVEKRIKAYKNGKK